MLHPQSLCLGFVVFGLLTAVSMSANDAAKLKVSQWVMKYYLQPDPENFVQRVRDMSAAGILARSDRGTPEQNQMFLGKVMAANSKKIGSWLDALSDLPPQEQAVLKRAAWYSGAVEGLAWLREHGEAALADGPRPMLLDKRKVRALQPYHLDQLWEWFFATGSEEPVARIVSLFSLAHELPRKDSIELLSPPLKPTKVQQGDKKPSQISPDVLYQLRVQNYRLLRPAMWSCVALATEHARVLEILKTAQSNHYHAGIKAWVAQIVRIAEAQRAQRGSK